LIVISGEPGVGKTRLLVELLDDVRRAEGVVLEGRAFEAERGRPFGPWIEAFRHVTLTRDDDHLAPLLSGQAPATGATREQMFQAAIELVAGYADRAGLVAVAIDDVQWIDEASAELLHVVARGLRGKPVLLALKMSGLSFINLSDNVVLVAQE
jgi:predicted ATPase